MDNSNKIILVTGATGKQGGAVAAHLLKAGYPVRALTRNASSKNASDLQAKGAEIAIGSMEDREALKKAVKGVYGVFSVQNFWEKGVGYEGEIRQAKNLADAAKETGVAHFIQASIADIEKAEGVKHFECKLVIENYIASLGLPYTVIREVFFMDNFLNTKEGKFIFPFLSGGLKPETKFHMLAVDDIGGIVETVISDPKKYISKKINAAGDILTVKEMKEIYQSITGNKPKSFKIPFLIIRLMNPESYKQLVWNNKIGWKFDLQETRQVYPQTTDFKTFIAIHRPQNL